MTALDWSLFPNFSREEFVCKGPCNCGRADMDPEFMRLLQILRDVMGRPVIINSGFRCPDYNYKISPKTGRNGPHTTGKSADVKVSGHQAWLMLGLVMQTFSGIGVKQHGPMEGRFIHLDSIVKGPRPLVWTYP